MRILPVLVFTFLTILLFSTPAHAATEHLYTETLDAYSRVEGETIRWDEKREFAIDDYQLYELNISGSITKFVNISMMDSSTNGLLHNVTEEVERINFVPKLSFWDDGSLKSVDWSIKLFRIAEPFREPFDTEVVNVLANSQLGHRRYDLYLETDFFSVSLEYYEFHIIDGERQKVKVNTELLTDNDEDGRSYRSVVHIIKRAPNGDVLFDYSHKIEEVTKMYRIFNLIDQPFIWVPAQIGGVILLIYIYIRFMRYWRDNNYRIIQLEDEDQEGVNDDDSE